MLLIHPIAGGDQKKERKRGGQSGVARNTEFGGRKIRSEIRNINWPIVFVLRGSRSCDFNVAILKIAA